MSTQTATPASVRLGSYETDAGERELIGVWTEEQWTLFDMATVASAEDDDRDERWVEDGLQDWPEVEAVAIEYLAQADFERAPLMRP